MTKRERALEKICYNEILKDLRSRMNQMRRTITAIEYLIEHGVCEIASEFPKTKKTRRKK